MKLFFLLLGLVWWMPAVYREAYYQNERARMRAQIEELDYWVNHGTDD